MNDLETGIQQRKTDTGFMRISSPALTAFDLLRYRQASGGLDHAASVLNELASEIDPEQLITLAPVFERSVVQRLGYIFDHLEKEELAIVLHRYLDTGHLPWVELDPGAINNAIEESEPQRDQRWNITVRRVFEIDEQ